MHASAHDMKMLFRGAGVQNDKPNKAIHNVCKTCNVCAFSGGPHERKKILINHVNEAFNKKVQANFSTAKIGDQKFEVFNMVDL